MRAIPFSIGKPIKPAALADTNKWGTRPGLRDVKARIYIGTSGWTYKSWAKSFYPEGWPARKSLEFYISKFPTVEINASFYRLPETKTFRSWREQAPDGFVYALKGSRAVTHLKRLQPGAKSFDLLLERSRALEPRLGPLLWQLPPNFKKNAKRLEQFLKRLPRRLTHAIEFRHPSWLDEEISKLLIQYGAANVSVSSQAMPMQFDVTTDFVYVRFHGLSGGAAHHYTNHELEPWADHLRDCARRGITGFVYFNNDANTRAPLNALQLMNMVGGFAIPPIGK
jgi:uncharacterized protein YecE (DUF72 family)